MSNKWKANDNSKLHFVTFAVNNWIDVFTRNEYKDIFCESIKYCQQHKGLELYGWVLMTNHVHLLIGCSQNNKISDIIRDLKKYTSVHVVRAITANVSESRRDWMLRLFANAALKSNKHEKFLFWQQEYHPVEIVDYDMYIQKLNYIHDNPVRAGVVFEQHHYVYSSAISYAGGQGLLKIEGI